MLEQDLPTIDTPGNDGASAVVDRPTRPAIPDLLRARRATGADSERLRALWLSIRMPLAVYVASRILFMGIALLDTAWHTWPLSGELSNWDGVWYVAVTKYWYPSAPSHAQTTLGFLPLYPMLIWVVKHVFDDSIVAAGMIISTIGGFISTVLIQRLSARWWGEQASRRVVLFYCFFPGAVVFSMVYSEGLSIPLVAGCLLALEDRRWVLAGILAGLATAVAPVTLAIIPACALAAFLEIRRRGWHDRDARRALWAPALAPAGIVAFAMYLWAHTGTPFASYIAQRHGWGEKSTPLAIYNQFKHLIHETVNVHSLHHPGINANYAAGAFGAIFLITAFVLIWRTKPRMSPAAIVLTLWTGILTLTSYNTPPNPRMIICGFPAIMVVAYACKGKAFQRLMIGCLIITIVMTFPTYVGYGLRP
jgi:hypothetical protein